MKLNNLLDWEVLEKSIQLEGGTPITNGKALVRSDNNQVLEVVNTNFVPLKNEELYKLIKGISEKEEIDESKINIIETKNGQRISAILDLDLKLTVKDDIVRNQLLIQNSHGGFSSLRFGFGNVVFSCTNGMVIMNNKIGRKIYHNKYLKIEIDHLLENIEVTKRNIQLFNEFSNRIADKQIDNRNQLVLDAINYVTNVDLSISKEDFIKNFRPKKAEYLLDYKWNSAKIMEESIHLEMENKGDNYWGLLNGFTYYNTHKSDAKNRNEFIIDGYGKIISDKAVKFIKERLQLNEY